MRLLRALADVRDAGSLANRMRRKRFGFFLSLLGPLPRPLRILDVGGTQLFWEHMGLQALSGVEILLCNLQAPSTTLPGFSSVAGDARDLRQFQDGEFEVVFSNSVIEHVGSFADQRRMAAEIQRVGRRYFLQTPNRYFPIEPHFLFPFFQFLPRGIQAGLVRRFDLGWRKKAPDSGRALQLAGSVRLLDRREIMTLFPGGTLREERLLGLTKSFMVYGGWQQEC